MPKLRQYPEHQHAPERTVAQGQYKSLKVGAKIWLPTLDLVQIRENGNKGRKPTLAWNHVANLSQGP